MSPAELDYALVAEYAKVEGGRLTIAGGGYTETTVPNMPSVQVIAVAGRIRAPNTTESVLLEIEFCPPGEGLNINVRGELTANQATHRYRDKIGVLFALNQAVLVTDPGVCTVIIKVDSEVVRRLRFDIKAAEK